MVSCPTPAEAGMKRFVEGEDRRQTTLLPDCIEDYVPEENPVRVIEAFVAALDLAELGFAGVVPERTGRPAYHPSTLLKLYVYGYLNRVQSSRRLEREAGRNLELMWLTGRLAPDFKTIADFRKDNGPAIRATCRRFVLLCRGLGLLSEVSVAIDSSKFKAVNARERNYTPNVVRRRMEQVEASEALSRRAGDGGSPGGGDGAGANRAAERQAGEARAADGAPPGDGGRRPRRARRAGLADGPGRARDGDDRQGHRPRRLQRAGRRGHQAPPDRGARGDQRRQRPRPALGGGRAGR